jgi:hypothetical protein
MRAAVTLFFDVDHFTMRRHLTIPARDAAARERREPEQANETHHGDLSRRAKMSNFCTDEVIEKEPQRGAPPPAEDQLFRVHFTRRDPRRREKSRIEVTFSGTRE